MKCVPFALLLMITPVFAQDVDFGDNSSEWAGNGECDDRRFVGRGMAAGVDWDDTGRDAADCERAFRMGIVKLWVEAEARAATQCEAIDFGDDSGEWANDNECDDIRFEGPGTDSILLPEDTGRDATDCQRACTLGTVFLRNY